MKHNKNSNIFCRPASEIPDAPINAVAGDASAAPLNHSPRYKKVGCRAQASSVSSFGAARGFLFDRPLTALSIFHLFLLFSPFPGGVLMLDRLGAAVFAAGGRLRELACGLPLLQGHLSSSGEPAEKGDLFASVFC